MGKAEKGSLRGGLTAPVVIVCLLLLKTSVATADPAAKVHLPTVVEGEVELELLGGYQWWRNNEDNRLRQFVGELGYGITSWWKTELGAGTTRVPSESYKLDEIEWENIFALTKPGEYWLDLGVRRVRRKASLGYDRRHRTVDRLSLQPRTLQTSDW
ncbi:MAG TPA: hypothetical protein VEN29_08700 [Casimicrobiaceae bacterium]|nr:hypothetical protein [Casimicrobiaceae bacterium]